MEGSSGKRTRCCYEDCKDDGVFLISWPVRGQWPCHRYHWTCDPHFRHALEQIRRLFDNEAVCIGYWKDGKIVYFPGKESKCC